MYLRDASSVIGLKLRRVLVMARPAFSMLVPRSLLAPYLHPRPRFGEQTGLRTGAFPLLRCLCLRSLFGALAHSGFLSEDDGAITTNDSPPDCVREARPLDSRALPAMQQDTVDKLDALKGALQVGANRIAGLA